VLEAVVEQHLELLEQAEQVVVAQVAQAVPEQMELLTQAVVVEVVVDQVEMAVAVVQV
jgi:predicted oxidoreductase